MSDIRSQMTDNTTHSFEQLTVWQEDHQYVLLVYEITRTFPKEEKYSLVDQIQRSTSSVPTNIIEGNERKSTKEFIQFIYTAKGLLAESKYQLILARDLQYIDVKSAEDLLHQASNVSMMITGLINYLRPRL